MPTAIWKSRLRSSSAHCNLEVAVDVRQTWKSRLRSGSAHCDLQLAVEVRQCPLGSGARGGGPAVPTGIWTARRRRRVRRRRRQRRRRRRRRTALIKSNNPHLAGGEKEISLQKMSFYRNMMINTGFMMHWIFFPEINILILIGFLKIQVFTHNHQF